MRVQHCIMQTLRSAVYCTGYVVARSAGTALYSTLQSINTVNGLTLCVVRDAGINTAQRRVQCGTV
jgi:hypothetical protein